MSRYEIMKLFETFDGEISEADFSPEELQKILKSRNLDQETSAKSWKQDYFSFYDDLKDKSLKKQDW